MRPFTLIIACMFLITCTDDTGFFNPADDHTVQYNETDFNFVLRAIHPSQEVVVTFGDGIRGRVPFRAAIYLKYPEIKGEASIDRGSESMHIKPTAARYECEAGGLRIIFDATLRSRARGTVWESRDVVISLESTDTSTDNPECIIWDIKDSDGSAVANFVADGKIWVKNSDCITTR